MHIVMIGPPGCGKGTQSKRLTNTCAIAHLSTGDMLREAMEQSTVLGKRVAAVVAKGDLVSDELVMELVVERIAGPDCAGGCLFDGVPRTVAQAIELDELLTARGECIAAAIQMEVADDELLRRIEKRAQSEGRADDTPETLRRRLHVYHSQTVPILDHYRQMGVLRPVDGLGSEDEVAARVQAQLPPP
jgi:adenylate kinase